MTIPIVNPSSSAPPVSETESTFSYNAPNDTNAGELFSQGLNANNVIIQGTNNRIKDSRRCTIINGSSNIISGRYNTHVIGDAGSVEVDNAFYVGCINGIYSEGDVVAFSSSDERLKDNIIPISGCLEKIQSLDAVEFDWNHNQQTYSGHDIGLIAQQVKDIAPEIIQERENGYLAVNYQKMIPLLVGAIKDQQDTIEKMKIEINELRNS